MSTFSLADRVAIVTGSRRGIGKAIALAFAKAGAHIVLVDIDLEDVESAAKEIRALGSKALGVKANLAHETEIHDMVRMSIEEFGSIDILVNNAGVIRNSGILEFSGADWRRILETNLISYHMCSKSVCPYMIAWRW